MKTQLFLLMMTQPRRLLIHINLVMILNLLFLKKHFIILFSSNKITSKKNKQTNKKKSKDILQAYQLIENAKTQFYDIRVNVNIFHEEWYKVALEFAEKVQLQEIMPRSCD